MRTWLLGLFKRQLCVACLALDRALTAQQVTIDKLEDEIKYLRSSLEKSQGIVSRLLHLDREKQPTNAPANYNDPGKSWPRMRAALEKKHTKQPPTPEDVKADYWKTKASEMEKEILNDTSTS